MDWTQNLNLLNSFLTAQGTRSDTYELDFLGKSLGAELLTSVSIKDSVYTLKTSEDSSNNLH